MKQKALRNCTAFLLMAAVLTGCASSSTQTPDDYATNEGYTTWYDFTKEILDEQGIKCKVNPVTTEEYIKMMNVVQAKRPFNSQMSKEKLKAQGINVPNWKDGLKRYLEEVKNEE